MINKLLFAYQPLDKHFFNSVWSTSKTWFLNPSAVFLWHNLFLTLENKEKPVKNRRIWWMNYKCECLDEEWSDEVPCFPQTLLLSMVLKKIKWKYKTSSCVRNVTKQACFVPGRLTPGKSNFLIQYFYEKLLFLFLVFQ